MSRLGNRMESQGTDRVFPQTEAKFQTQDLMKDAIEGEQTPGVIRSVFNKCLFPTLFLLVVAGFQLWGVWKEPSWQGEPWVESELRLGWVAGALWWLMQLISAVEAKLTAWAHSTATPWDDVLWLVLVRASRIILPLLATVVALRIMEISSTVRPYIDRGITLLIIAVVGLGFCQFVLIAEKTLLTRYEGDKPEDFVARRIRSQVRMMRRIILVLIGIFTVASMLMVFDSVRHFGTSILASAGIVGIVVGFAAQRSLSALFARIPTAFTQPIRGDDVVVVENEWGRIEEIYLTYVVVRLWDLRRLIVPINYFIERPFQNWTRVSNEIVGAVAIHVDYSAPIDAMRTELRAILDRSKLWDGRTQVLQVKEAHERTVEIRILVSAANSAQAFDLRCEVREQMIGFLQRHYPQSLPKLHVEHISTSESAVSSAF